MGLYSNRAGYYKEMWNEHHGFNGHYSFIPKSVCEISIGIDDELCGLLSNAHRLLGLLEGSCRYICNIDNFTRLMIIQEAYASCTIDDEMKINSFEFLYQSKSGKQKNKPIQNYIDAIDYGIRELNRIHLSNRVICSTHQILMAHKCESEIIGGIRKEQNHLGRYMIGNIDASPIYNPPEPESVDSCMRDIQDFVKQKDAMDALIKTALIHYQFEVVHPFMSGNGKMGRILIALYLFDKRILRETIFPVSEFLKANKVEYFDRIAAVHNFGHYEQWVKFFIKSVAATADICLKRIDKLIQYRKGVFSELNSYGKDSKYLLDAYRYIEKCIFFSIDSLASGIGVSYNTAARVVNILVELSFIKLLKEQARNRVYFCSDLLETLGFNSMK